MTDRQLLERFLQQNHAGAFEELVRVHGPMVLKVCHRILLNHHDAEEAFQATFLVLARKAASLLGRPSVAGWLHEVAHRTALNARRTRAQRQRWEQQVEPMPDVIAQTAEFWTDVAPLLDQELSRLPEKYRLPVVLCDLEGQRLQDVAAQLGCPLGTLSSRLTRAREMLRQRLIRRGVVVSSGVLAMALSQQAASASVPAALVSSTVQVVNVWVTSSAVTVGVISPHIAALTEGVLKTMFISALKNVVVAATVIAVAGLGAGGVIYQMSAAESKAKPQEVKDVLEKLRGEWKAVRVEEKGQAVPEADLQAIRPRMTFTDKKFNMTLFNGNEERGLEATMKIDTAKQPFEIDLSDVMDMPGNQPVPPGMGMLGIFQFEGETLRLRMKGHLNGKDSKDNPIKRPMNFETTENPESDTVDSSWTLERVK